MSPTPCKNPQSHPLCPSKLVQSEESKGKQTLVGMGGTRGRREGGDDRAGEVVVVMKETVLVYQFGDEETVIEELM